MRLESTLGKGTRLTVELPARSRPPVEDTSAVDTSQPLVEPIV
jgi:hypothetical protein